MPNGTKSRVRAPYGRTLDLPPPFRLITLREAGDAFVHACAIAGAEGAGTLVHVGRFDLAELAVVLEPDAPLRTARRALYTGLCALGDALAALAPPEKPISFDWPDAVRVDGGLVGGARLAWPRDADENEPPDWLVLGAMVRIAAAAPDGEPGLAPFATTLAEEGFGELDSGRLTEGFARHLMANVDAEREHGFGETARRYLARVPPAAGRSLEIDAQGDLLVRIKGGAIERHALVSTLRAPSWLDPQSNAPRLDALPPGLAAERSGTP
jgi:Biotin/lipoate A/B protein ligase family